MLRFIISVCLVLLITGINVVVQPEYNHFVVGYKEKIKVIFYKNKITRVVFFKYDSITEEEKQNL